MHPEEPALGEDAERLGAGQAGPPGPEAGRPPHDCCGEKGASGLMFAGLGLGGGPWGGLSS